MMTSQMLWRARCYLVTRPLQSALIPAVPPGGLVITVPRAHPHFATDYDTAAAYYASLGM